MAVAGISLKQVLLLIPWMQAKAFSAPNNLKSNYKVLEICFLKIQRLVQTL